MTEDAFVVTIKRRQHEAHLAFAFCSDLGIETFTCNAGIEVEVIIAAAQSAPRISGCDNLSPQALLDSYAKTVNMSSVALQAAHSLLKVCQWEAVLSGGPSLPSSCYCYAGTSLLSANSSLL